MWLFGLALSVGVIIVGCAIALGANSSATINNQVDTKREVTKDTPVIEEILLEQQKGNK
jgi:predicted porin